MIAMPRTRTETRCHSCGDTATYIFPDQGDGQLGLCPECFDELLNKLERAREAFDAMEEQPRTRAAAVKEISLIAAGVIFAVCVLTMALLGLLCWMF